jgi:hypothetical protein
MKIGITRENFIAVFDLIRYQNCCLECKNYVPYDDEAGKCLEMKKQGVADNGVLPLSVCNLWEQK